MAVKLASKGNYFIVTLENGTEKIDYKNQFKFNRDSNENYTLTYAGSNLISEKPVGYFHDESDTAFANATAFEDFAFSNTGGGNFNSGGAAPQAIANYKGTIIPSSTPTGTGEARWDTVTAGTYTHFGGVVVTAGNYAIISRDADGNFSISQTVFDASLFSLKTDFSFERTYNLLDISKVREGKQFSTTGVISNASTNITPNVEIKGNTTYTILGKRSNGNLLFLDVNEAFVSFITNNTTGVVTSPANAKYIVYYLDTAKDYSGCMIFEGTYKGYLPYALPKNTSYLGTKLEVENKEMLDLNLNQYFGNLKNTTDFVRSESAYVTRVNNTNEALLNYGVLKLSKWNSFTSIAMRFGQNIVYPTAQDFNNHYVYMTGFIKTNNLSFVPDYLVNATYSKDSTNVIRTTTLISKKYTQIELGVWKFDLCVKLLNFNVKELNIRFDNTSAINSTTNEYYTSGLAYAISPTFHSELTLVKSKFAGGKKSQFLRKVITSNYELIENSLTAKKVCLFGTSIEAGGYFDKVAEAYNMNYLNFGNSGGGLLWTNNPTVGNAIWNIPANTSPLKAFSATWAEKEAYLIAQGIPYTDQARLDCFDQSMLANLDSDLFIIGTYGINDRKSADAFVVDRINRKYDRTTIFGAYHYFLRALFEAKPLARVVITGQHCFGWENTKVVHEIQREVAKDWCIPFIDMACKLGFSNEVITVGGVAKTVLTQSYAPDGAHPNPTAEDIMAELLIRELRTII